MYCRKAFFMADSENINSKRTALRWSGLNRQLTYKTDYEDGEARLVNISTSGCAISNTTTELRIDQKILLTITLDAPEQQIQTRALVIRKETEGFGLQFLHLAENIKQQLFRYFAIENRRMKSKPTSTSQ